MRNKQHTKRWIAPVALSLGAALALAGCSGDSDKNSDGNLGADGAENIALPKVDMLSPDADKDAAGTVTVCGGKDAAGAQADIMKMFNDSHPGITAKYVELGADTDATRTAAIQRLEGGATDCDVYFTDLVWTPEWASQGWIYDMTDVIKDSSSDIFDSVVSTTEYGGHNWSMPYYTNAGLMFYRTDRVSEVPTTWKEIYADAASSQDKKLLIQAKPYEGLTVNFLELLYSAGGEVINDKGEIVIDSDVTREVLTFMRDGFKNGAIDPATLTYVESDARRAFESGVGGYERNWPSAWASGQATDIASVMAVAPLPAFDNSNKPAAALGGWNLAVPLNTKNPGGALAVIKYMAEPDVQKDMFLNHSQPPVIESVYDDPDVAAQIPFASQLKASLESAKPRPKSPVYPMISRAIYENVYDVINGDADVDATVTKIAEEIQKSQETF